MHAPHHRATSPVTAPVTVVVHARLLELARRGVECGTSCPACGAPLWVNADGTLTRVGRARQVLPRRGWRGWWDRVRRRPAPWCPHPAGRAVA